MLSYILRMIEFSGIAVPSAAQTDVLRRLSLAGEARAAQETSFALMQCFPASEQPLPDDPDALARKLEAYLAHNFITLENLEEITTVFPYNYAYLSRLFKRSTGLSMGQYLLAKRMELAQQLICNNETLTVAEIAEMAGYHDSRYFTRTFKTYFGMTPTEYRASKIALG